MKSTRYIGLTYLFQVQEQINEFAELLKNYLMFKGNHLKDWVAFSQELAHRTFSRTRSDTTWKTW